MAGRHRSGDPGADPEDAVWRPPFPRLVRGLLVTVVVLAGLSLALPNVAPDVPWLAAEGSPARMVFGVSQEANVPTAFSVALLLAAATAHAVVGRLVGGRTGTAFTVVALVLVALAFDDFAALHERLVVVAELIGIRDGYAWVVPGLLVAAGVVAVFVRLVTHLRGRVRRDLLVGILLFLGAAFGLESVNGLLDRPGTDGAPLQIGTHVEEVLENVGVVLVLRAALGMVVVTGRRDTWSIRLAGAPGTGRPGPASSRDVDRPAPAERTEPIPAAR
jgi:hypothetical protein